MMGIALVVVLLTVPLLAYLASTKIGKSRYTQVSMVQLPPPKPQPKPPAQRKAQHHAPPPHRAAQAHAPAASRPLPVHVAAATTPAASGSGDDNAIQNGTGNNIGQVPAAPPAAPAAAPAPALAAPPPPPPPPPAPKPAPAPPPAPAPEPDQPAQVIADTEVKPMIPDELQGAPLDSEFRALFTVRADGDADVKMIQTTGSNELDQLALQAARQWKFRPAVHEGKAVDSYLRLYVEFQVS